MGAGRGSVSGHGLLVVRVIRPGRVRVDEVGWAPGRTTVARSIDRDPKRKVRSTVLGKRQRDQVDVAHIIPRHHRIRCTCPGLVWVRIGEQLERRGLLPVWPPSVLKYAASVKP